MNRVMLAFVMLTVGSNAGAQVSSTATPLAPVFAAGCEAKPALDALTLRFNQGDWSAFQREGRALLDALRGVHPASAEVSVAAVTASCTAPATVPASSLAALDYTTHHVAVAWIGADALGKTQLMRAVIHWPEGPAYSADLPGVGRLTEVFIAGTVGARAASLYTSTAEKDPFAEQVPGVVQALFGPLSTTVAGIAGGVTGKAALRSFAPPPTPPSLSVSIRGVVLPVARASVRLQMHARDLVTAEEFTAAVERLESALRFGAAGRSTPARTQITTLLDELPEKASKNCAVAGGAVPSPVECRAALDTLIKSAYDTATAGKVSDADVAAIVEVDRQFRTLAVNGMSTSADRDMTFKNRPPTHFSFGGGSAVMGYARVNRVRAKVDGGSLVSDPLPRVMTLAFVNWSPGGYDEASALSVRERVRAFFGAAVTPDFGVVGGVNILLQRGIGVVGGVGLLFGKGAEPDEIGKPPAATEDPFRLALGRTVFMGISYNYK